MVKFPDKINKLKQIKQQCPCIGCKNEFPNSYTLPKECADCKKYDEYVKKLEDARKD